MSKSIQLCVAAITLLFANVASGLVIQDENKKPDTEDEKKLPTIAEKTAGLALLDGFQRCFYDEAEGKIWLEISDFEREFLFAFGLSTGLGSNPVGLDRGQLGRQYVCRFERVGKKVFLTAKNLDYRAITDNLLEQRAVRESFAESILWGATVAARTDGTVLVDITDMMISDMHGVVDRLQQANQGEYSVDALRSGIYVDRCKGFPKNTELEATLTFSGKKPGPLVSQVTPAPKSITLRQHFSFVELPDDAYQPRRHDPRCPSISIRFADYATPIDAPLEKRWITRHRLIKKHPDQAMSHAIEPIVYYVDAAAPQPIKDALIEGASWWRTAFEAAGFQDAYQVKVMPPDADPMDVRYNVIQWVHRSTRGWSYGGSVIDPRTGEILKGHVTLGSLRVRQDRLLFEGLLPRGMSTIPESDRNCSCCGIAGVSEDTMLAGLFQDDIAPLETALARIRQLSAHEVGHTLGFVHNFAASTYHDRASVMDYPAPRIKITEDGNLDLSDAYGVGIGSWDIWGVRFAYTQFAADVDEQQELQKLIDEAAEKGMRFISDADSRPAGAAHPLASLWDNGQDSIEQLKHTMRVRRIALDRINGQQLLPGQPLADLEQLFVPVYLHHRYQLDATAKMIGGVYYEYSAREQWQNPMSPVAASRQRQALEVLLSTIEPHELVIPTELLGQMTPKPYLSSRDIERFQGRTAPIFDSLAAARVAADITVGNLLQPQRLARLAMMDDHESKLGADEVARRLVDKTWSDRAEDKRLGDVSRVVRESVTDHILGLIENPASTVFVKAAAESALDVIKTNVFVGVQSENLDERYFCRVMREKIKRFENRPNQPAVETEPLKTPPGSPIGDRQ